MSSKTMLTRSGDADSGLQELGQKSGSKAATAGPSTKKGRKKGHKKVSIHQYYSPLSLRLAGKPVCAIAVEVHWETRQTKFARSALAPAHVNW